MFYMQGQLDPHDKCLSYLPIKKLKTSPSMSWSLKSGQIKAKIVPHSVCKYMLKRRRGMSGYLWLGQPITRIKRMALAWHGYHNHVNPFSLCVTFVLSPTCMRNSNVPVTALCITVTVNDAINMTNNNISNIERAGRCSVDVRSS